MTFENKYGWSSLQHCSFIILTTLTQSNLTFSFLQDAFDEAVKFFGENSKTTPPSVFFPVFVRFVKAYRVNPYYSLNSSKYMNWN